MMWGSWLTMKGKKSDSFVALAAGHIPKGFKPSNYAQANDRIQDTWHADYICGRCSNWSSNHALINCHWQRLDNVSLLLCIHSSPPNGCIELFISIYPVHDTWQMQFWTNWYFEIQRDGWVRKLRNDPFEWSEAVQMIFKAFQASISLPSQSPNMSSIKHLNNSRYSSHCGMRLQCSYSAWYKVAYMHAELVPITVPLSWGKYVLSNWNVFLDMTISRMARTSWVGKFFGFSVAYLVIHILKTLSASWILMSV